MPRRWILLLCWRDLRNELLQITDEAMLKRDREVGNVAAIAVLDDFGVRVGLYEAGLMAI